jgi:NADH dehydrogenase
LPQTTLSLIPKRAFHRLPTRLPRQPKISSSITIQIRNSSFRAAAKEFGVNHPYASLALRLVLSSILGVGVLIGAIFIHDTTTYTERHTDRVPVNPLSLNPRKGGKNNLPIIEVNLDDEEDETKRSMKDKPRLVIIGGGWGVSGLRARYVVKTDIL